MAFYNNQNDRGGMGPRPLVDVSSLNLTCAKCGAPIAKLPFSPQMNPDGTPARAVFCAECNRERKNRQMM